MDERGIKTAVEGEMAARAAGAAEIAAEVEADLLGPIQINRPRGPGRPAGSINRSTEDWRRFIRARYGDPREFLAAVMATDTVDLVKEHLVEFKSALAIRVRCAEALLPYMAKKLPLEAQLEVRQMPTLNVVDQFRRDAQLSAGDGLVVSLIPSGEQNQWVSDEDDEQSNVEQSNVSGEGVDIAEQSASGIDNEK